MPTIHTKEDTLRYLEESLTNRSDVIPPLPKAVLEVQTALASSQTGARHLAKEILSDPALTAKVLKLANSVFHGVCDQEIKTVTSAILLLGFDQVNHIVMGIAVFKMLNDMNRGCVFKQNWAHSVTAATCAQLLAKRQKFRLPEQAFIAALLMDIGKIVLAQCFPKEYQRVVGLVQRERKSWTEAERIVFKCTHLDAGQLVAEHWGLPKKVSAAIGDHEIERDPKRLEKTVDPLVQTIMLSNEMATMLCEDGPNPPTLEQLRELCRLMRLDPGALDDTVEKVKSQVHELAKILDLDLSEWKKEWRQAGRKEAAGGAAGSSEFTQAALAVAEAASVETLAIDRSQRLQFTLLAGEQAETCANLSLFLYQTVSKLTQLLHLNYLFLLRKDKASNRLITLYAHGQGASQIKDKIAVGLEAPDDVAAHAFLKKEKVVFSDENRFQFNRPSSGNLIWLLQTSRVAALPVLVGPAPRAVLVCSRSQETVQMDEDDLRLLSAYARSIGVVLSRKENEDDFS